VSALKRYRTRSPGSILARSIAPLLVFTGLFVIGYSLLIHDPFAAAALLGPDAPKNSTMKLTIPEMQRVQNVPVYDGPMTDKSALHDGVLHVNSTGFPW
jgi:sortase A